MEISGNPEDNLVVKAYLLLDKEFHLCPIEIHLYKHIPSGAGLGGGSSDAAFMLKLLNEHFQLNLSEDQLEIYAATLGADCAFFIKKRPDLCRRNRQHILPHSTILKRISDSDHQTGCIRINAGSFRQYSPHHPEYSIKEAIKRPVNEWKEILINDFEDSVFPQHPVIGEIKAELYRQGAVYASMSGSVLPYMDCSNRKGLYLKPIGELTYSVLKAGCKRVTKNVPRLPS